MSKLRKKKKKHSKNGTQTQHRNLKTEYYEPPPKIS